MRVIFELPDSLAQIDIFQKLIVVGVFELDVFHPIHPPHLIYLSRPDCLVHKVPLLNGLGLEGSSFKVFWLFEYREGLGKAGIHFLLL